MTGPRLGTCFALAATALISVAAAGEASASQDDPRLDPLFLALKEAPSELAARSTEAQIWAVWSEIGDVATAQNFNAGTAAMARRAYLEAKDAFTAATRRSPNFAEAWNKLATVDYLIGDLEGAVTGIRQTLALEPRHFGALSGLGLVYIQIGSADAAIRSFEAALAIYPKMAGARAHIDMLRGDRNGDPT